MNRLRLTKILVVAAAGLALAAGSVAAIAASDGGDEPAGLAVRHVVPESPAADAGLERGDVITAIDGQAVTEFEALANAVQAKAAGDTVTLSVIKDGVDNPDAEAQDVEATLEARPDEANFRKHIGGDIGKLFDRFVDGQFRYLDEDGNTVSVEVVAGTVTSISDTEITLDVNGDDEGERAFDIPEGVNVPEGLAQGDQAAVVIKDGAVERILPGGFPFPLPGIASDFFPVPDGGFKLPFDGEGNALSVEVITGTISSVSADEITLDLSGDQGEKSFSIPDGVEVPEGLEAGEQATVVVQNGEVMKIVEGGLPFDGDFKFPFDDEAPFPHPFRGGRGFPFEEPAIEPDGAAPEA